MKSEPAPTMKSPTRSATRGQKRKRATAADAVPAEVAPPAVEPTPAAPVAETPAAAAGNTVTLAASCSIKEVAALHRSLVEAVGAEGPVCIDASAVERIDTATLQLLYAFVRDRVTADREVVWQNVTGALSESARQIGMRDLLCLPADAGLAA